MKSILGEGEVKLFICRQLGCLCRKQGILEKSNLENVRTGYRMQGHYAKIYLILNSSDQMEI